VRFNRAEGMAFGLGLVRRLGAGVSVSGTGRWGTADRRAKGRIVLRWQDARGRAVRLFGETDLRDVGEAQERSTFVNSIAAQELGSDQTDPIRLEAAGVGLTLPALGVTWTFEGAHERHRAAAIRASPAAGRFEEVLPAAPIAAVRVRLVADRPTGLTVGGLELRGRGEVSLMQNRARASFDLDIQRDVGPARFASRTIGALVHSDEAIPVQELVYFGGAISAPGFDFHTLAGEAAVSQRLELRFGVPFPAIPLGRFGRSAGRATLAPFATAVALSSPGRVSFDGAILPGSTRFLWRGDGIYPSLGMGLQLFFDLVRIDVARGLRDGAWRFYVDVNRSFWSVL
jgi:hypothetical protein